MSENPYPKGKTDKNLGRPTAVKLKGYPNPYFNLS